MKRDRSNGVAALMMVRNEQDVVANCIGHLLNTVGVDRVYVVDNGSTDRTPALLQAIARRDDRVTIERDEGGYRHGEIITALAHRAMADGAAWLLPTDADEFLWLRPGVSLAALCNRPDIGGYRLEVRNFMQNRSVRRVWPGSIMTMCVAAVPVGSPADSQARVASGEISFVQIAYAPKVLVRAAPSLSIAFGNHDASQTAGPWASLTEGELLHAPMRAFSRLAQRAESGRRAEVATPDPGSNWHLKRVAAMDAVGLAEEWRRNSFSLGWPARRGVGRVDLRLCRVGLRQAGFRRGLDPG